MTRWEPTKHGGHRRTGIAQEDGTRTLRSGQSATRSKWRSVVRIHLPVLKFREKLGLPECPYAMRWRVEFPFGSVRLHHWLSPDDDRAFHDHPWWLVTLVLRGGYTDRSPSGDDHLGRFSFRYRPALHRHTVVPDEGGAWTLLVTGPPVRSWGFWLDGKFRKANKWFLEYGHHPCQHQKKEFPPSVLPPARDEHDQVPDLG